MKKEYRIKKTKEIEYLIKQKKCIRSKLFSIFFKKNNLDHFKYALSVGKKIGNSVKRNYYKRILKDIIYKNRLNILCYDFFIIVKEDILKYKYDNIFLELKSLLSRFKKEEV